MNFIATNFLNALSESTGFPSNWAQSTSDPSSLGFKWAIGDGSYLNPFAPMRLMDANNDVSYSSSLYGDLSSSSLNQWPGANLFFRTDDSITYEDASQLLNTNGTYGWRVTYTPAYSIEISASAPSVVPWYIGWSYRMALTINHTKVPVTMIDYPILISVTQPPLRLHARSDGADILFTSSDKLTKIPHEIDFYDYNTGGLNAWVRVPALSNTTDTVIYVYYGNPTADNQESPSLVWAGYTSVFHMEDDPDASHILDSSINGLTGTKAGDHEPTEIIEGAISFAQDFDGSNDYIALDQSSLTSNVEVFELWLNSFRASTSQTILSSGFKNNTLGFLDISRPPQTDVTNGYDLMIDYAANSAWVQRAATAGIDLTCLVAFKNNLYGGASDGRFFKWDGVSAWVATPSLPSPEGFSSLTVFNNKLYAGTNGAGKLYEWDVGYTSWILRAPSLKIKSLVLKPSDSKIYGGTDDGRLLRWNTATNKWDVVAPQLGSENSINTLVIFGSDIYAGTSPGGKLYRWNGASAWVEVASPPASNPFTDVVSSAVYGGKIYAGTNPGGYLMSWVSGTEWVLEQTTGETLISALYMSSTGSFTQTFNYAAGGSSGGWTNADNAMSSNNQYLTHVPEIIRSPSSYPSAVWTLPQNAYSSNGAYATRSDNSAQTYTGYGTFASTDPIFKSLHRN